MTREDRFWIVLIGTLFVLHFGAVFHAILHADAQSQVEWSHGRLVIEAGVVASVVSRERMPDGTVFGEARQDSYVGAQDPDRVADFAYEPDRSYVTACGFTLRDPVTYPDTAFLPVTVRRR